MAVTVVLAFSVTVQVAPFELPQPDHDENVLAPAVPGAVRDTEVPALYVRTKPVLPEDRALLSAGEALMATPLAGVDELTVSEYVWTGGGCI